MDNPCHRTVGSLGFILVGLIAAVVRRQDIDRRGERSYAIGTGIFPSLAAHFRIIALEACEKLVQVILRRGPNRSEKQDCPH